jgi:ribonucleotide monophosphatase NagD (HAD superfamily)
VPSAIDRIQGCLIDLDGTVYQEGRAIDGAASAIDALRRADVPFRFATNTTRMPRAALAGRLAALGIPAGPEEILSAPSAAARWLRSRGVERAAARELGLPPNRIAVIGDDLEGDVLGAREAGMIGVAVRTGKYRPEDEERIQAAADLVVDSLRWPLTSSSSAPRSPAGSSGSPR